MSFQYVREMPSVKEIMQTMPLSANLKKLKQKRDEEIREVFERNSDKFLVIIGPCSADNEDSVCDYVSRLAGLQEEPAGRVHEVEAQGAPAVVEGSEVRATGPCGRGGAA